MAGFLTSMEWQYWLPFKVAHEKEKAFRNKN